MKNINKTIGIIFIFTLAISLASINVVSVTLTYCNNGCIDRSSGCGGGEGVAGYDYSCPTVYHCCLAPSAISGCAAIKGWSGNAPNCSPPPPPPSSNPPPPSNAGDSCGDEICQWTTNYKESCGNPGENINGGSCITDCGRCQPDLGTWCNINCVASNGPPSSYPNYCGEGWTDTNNWGNYRYPAMYCKDIPAGTTCGTCDGASVCGDNNIMGNEQCDDGNTNTESCTYGQTSCPQICNSDCQLATGSTSYCGDSSVDTGNGETCDDGNTIPGDGCSATCTVEQGYGCPTPGSPCVRGQEICFNGIDDNGVNGIDEDCGGCADLNEDGKVYFDDLFILADFVGTTEADCDNSANYPTDEDKRICKKQYHMIDWKDDGRLDLVPEPLLNAQTNVANFNGDSVVDEKDLNILLGEFGQTGNNLVADLNNDGTVNFDDFFIFNDQYGTVVILEDFRYFAQQFIKDRYLPCGQQIIEDLENRKPCYSDFQCISSHCSIAERDIEGRFIKIGKEGDGHCCDTSYTWNEGIGDCQETVLKSCSCPYSPLDPIFWAPSSGCLNVGEQWACVRTKLLGNEEQLTIEIIKR